MMLPENPMLRDGLLDAISSNLVEKISDVVVLDGDFLEKKSNQLIDSQVDALLFGLRADSISRVCVSKNRPRFPYFTIKKDGGIWRLWNYVSEDVTNKSVLAYDMEILSAIMEVEGVEELAFPLGLLKRVDLENRSVKPQDLFQAL